MGASRGGYPDEEPNMRTLIRKLASDEGVSPVIGTILMVAVTVVLGATVFAAVNGFGSKGVQESTNAVFKATAVDTDGNGRTDTMKLTYLTGPTGVALSDVSVNVNPATTLSWTRSDLGADGVANTADDEWSPGDFTTVNPAARTTYFVSVSILGTTVLDQAVALDE